MTGFKFKFLLLTNLGTGDNIGLFPCNIEHQVNKIFHVSFKKKLNKIGFLW